VFKVMLNTGTLCHQMTDFDLDGFIPCAFARVYRSSPISNGPLGFGWHWPWDITLTLTERELVQSSAGGLVEERFTLAAAVNSLISSPSGATAFVGKTKILVSLASGWIYRFPLPSHIAQSVRLEAIRDLRGNELQCANANGDLYQMTDANGRQYGIRRDHERRVVSIDLLRGGVPGLPARLVTYEYDRAGDLVRVRDRAGADAEYQYDAHLMVAYRNRAGGWYYADYDEERRCIRTDRSDGRAARLYHYDTVRRQVLVLDALGHGTLNRFDEQGRLSEVVDASGAKTSMAYGADGGLLATIESSGRTSTLSVQSNGPTREMRTCDPVGCERTIATNPEDRTETTTDCAGATWTRWFDEAGNLSSLVTPLGGTYRFEYDARGKVVRAFLPTGNTVQYVFSADYRHVDITDDLGPVASLTWDLEGRLLRKALGEDNPEEYRYDALGRMQEMVRPNGSSVRFAVDAEGSCVSVTNEAGETTDLEWSVFGELIAGVDDLGGRFRNHYDAALRLIAVSNVHDERVEFEYDAIGRPIRQRFFDGTEERYRYGVQGTPTAIAYSDGSTVALEYDAAGRPLAVVGEDHVVRFEYDPRGYPLTTQRDGIVVQYEYDLEGRVVLETQDGIEIRRAFDAAGNCVAVDVAGLGVRRCQYDQRQRLIEVEDFNGDRVRLAYDVRDRCTSVGLAPNVALEHEYLPQNLLNRARLRAGAQGWEARYEYDPAGRVIRRLGPGLDVATFEYGRAGQLARAVHDGAAASFSFSATGDPLEDAAGNAITYSPGERIRSAGARTFEFDGRGRVVAVTNAGRRAGLTYDHLNWLTHIHAGDGVTEYQYDATGRRLLKRSSSGEETRFVWDGDWLLAELRSNADDSLAYLGWAWRVFGASSPNRRGQSSLVLTDISGHPLVMAGADSLARLDNSDPWGAKGAMDVRRPAMSIRFAGQYEDQESGLFYNRYRYYDPSARRYLTPDPIRLVGAVNPYLYQIDPINNIDPYGLATVVAHDCKSGTPAAKTSPPATIPDDPGCSRGSSIHNDCITKTRDRARGAGYTTRADQSMEHGASNNRPDLRMSNPSQRVYVEWDNPPASRAPGHLSDICANDPGAVVILVTLTTRYGSPGGPTSAATTAGTRTAKAKMGKGTALSDSDCGIDDMNTELAARGLPTI
jgi:RHS repeat-associated protein